MTVFKWSKTATDNDDSDSSATWREGMAPSQVNNSARAVMAAIAKWRDDINGTLVTSGTSTAYTLTTNQNITGESGVPDGFVVCCKMHAANGATPTLAVDSQSASPITYKAGFAPDAGMLEAESVQTFRYNLSDDEWVLVGIVARVVEEPGVAKEYYGSDLPAGYVWANGTTIGNASSNATGRANADCANLFAKLWSALSNTELPILDSAGSTTTRGSTAADDFAANKQLPVIDRRDRGAIGKGTMGGASAAGRVLNTSPVSIDTSKIGAVGGADRGTLVQNQLPTTVGQLPQTDVTMSSNTLIVRNPNLPTIKEGTGNQFSNVVQNQVGLVSVTGVVPATNIGNSGGGQAHTRMNPVIVCNVIVKL